ncbi:MAG: DinB family protein, partial [Syntrophobacteraceae bacterium]
MDVEVCRLFARYNRHANKEMNLFIERLDDAQWNREFGGYFKSIKENCNHIYIADFNWLKRFSNLRSFDYIRKPIFERDIAFGTVPLAEVPDYLQKREEMDNLLIEFTNELDNGDLEMQLHYLDSRGEP